MPNPSKRGKQPWIGPLIVYMNHILQRFKDRCADEFVTVQVDPNKLVLELVLDDLLKEYPDMMLVWNLQTGRFADDLGGEFPISYKLKPLDPQIVSTVIRQSTMSMTCQGYRANHETKSNYLLSQLAESLSRPL